MKKKIIIDCFHLYQAHGGIRTYILQLCQAIEESENSDFEFIILPDWQKANEATFLRGRVNLFKKIINHLAYFIWKQIVLPIQIVRKKADVIVSPDYVLPFFKFGARSISVIHDIFYWELKDRYNPMWRAYYLWSIEKGLNSRSSIVVTSNFIKERVLNKVFDQYPIQIVYQSPKVLGQTVTLHQPNIVGLPKGAKYFLHIGTFEKRKSLGTLVMAFEKLVQDKFFEDFYLVLVGSPSVTYFDKTHDDLVRLVDERSLQDKVIFTGYLSDKALPSIYSSAFCYVFPSLEEGFGIPVIEAGNAGLPVIISDQSALVEVAGGSALVFKKGDYLDLYENMKRLEDDELRLSLIQSSLERAKVFTKENFLDQFIQAILVSMKNTK